MKNKVLQKPQVQVGSGRNDFDRSFISNFASHLGVLDVCMMEPVIAGTKGRINRRNFTRTAQVVAPAFMAVTEHFDFFKVPIKSLWSFWEDWKLGINDMKSSILYGYADEPASLNPIQLPTLPTLNFRTLDTVYENAPTHLTNNPNFHTLLKAFGNQFLSLREQLGYGSPEKIGSTSSLPFPDRTYNLLPYAAYHKVYYEHYRNSNYENNQPAMYNLDYLNAIDVDAQFGSTNYEQTLFTFNFFKKHHVNYRTDYFHNVYPSLNYSDTQPFGSQLSVPESVYGLPRISYGGSVMKPYLRKDGYVTGSATVVTDFDAIDNTFFSRGFTVQNIRAAFALDKLSRASMYAPKHITEQYKAQFGVDVPEDNSLTSQRLGSFQNDVLFQEVTNMAETSSASLGALGAKGLGSDGDGRDIDFYAEHDSIILGIHYFNVRTQYDAYMSMPFNLATTQGEFYQRAFENLGLRPLFSHDLYDKYSSDDLLGFIVPYQSYKLGIDRNFGPFKRYFSEFQIYASDEEQVPTIIDGLSSPLRNFTVHSQQYDYASSSGTTTEVTLQGIGYGWFKCLPSDLDYVFAEQFDGLYRPSSPQFFGEFRIKFVVVAPMSVHGQPVV